MKLRLLTVGCLFLASCKSGPDRNQIMTGLLNEQKQLKDSLAIRQGHFVSFTELAKAEINARHPKSEIDSAINQAQKQNDLMIPIEKRLKELKFSIDSLTKMIPFIPY